MKTYPYHTPEGIIELVEQREYDELAELALKLANLRAEDMATIKELREAIKTAYDDLLKIATMPKYDQDDSHRLRNLGMKAASKLQPFIIP
jgi:hypothetical protein